MDAITALDVNAKMHFLNQVLERTRFAHKKYDIKITKLLKTAGSEPSGFW